MQGRTPHDTHVQIFDIAAIASAIWRYRYRVLITFAGGGILGATLALSMPNQYESKARVEIEDSPLPTFSNPISAVFGGQNSAASQIAIIDSNSIKTAAIVQSDFVARVYSTRLQRLRNLYNRLTDVDSSARSRNGATTPPITVDELTVPQNWQDEAFTMKILNHAQFILTLPDGRQVDGSFGDLLKFEDQFKAKLNKGSGRPGDEYSLMRYSLPEAMEHFTNSLSVEEIGKTGLLSLSFVAESADQALTSLDALLAEFISADTRHAVETAQTRLDYIESEISPAIQLIEEAEDALTRFQKDAQTVNIEFEAESLLRQVSQIELLLREDQIPREKDRLEAIRGELFSRLSAIPDSQQHVLNLTRDIEIAQTIYLELMKRVQELRVARASARGAVRVIDQPYAYAKPIGPNRLQLTILVSLAAVTVHLLIISVRYLTPPPQSFPRE